MDYQHITLNIEDSVAVLTLNRPDALNSFVNDMVSEIRAVLKGIRDGHVSARVLFITGAGRGFCAGADLVESINPSDPEMADDIGLVLERYYNDMIKELRTLPIPTIAAVNGPCAGAGMSLALACDLVYAARSAFFLQAFVNISLVPDAGSSYFLPRLVGKARAARMMMLGERISAEDAERWGMLSGLMDDDKLIPETTAIAQRLARGATGALTLIRDMLNRSEENSLAEQLDLERLYQRRAGRLADFQEGVKAFTEKRKPVFRGE